MDTNLFNPSKKEEGFFQRKFGVQVKGNVVLYVGRVSKEEMQTFLLVRPPLKPLALPFWEPKPAERQCVPLT